MQVKNYTLNSFYEEAKAILNDNFVALNGHKLRVTFEITEAVKPDKMNKIECTIFYKSDEPMNDFMLLGWGKTPETALLQFEKRMAEYNIEKFDPNTLSLQYEPTIEPEK